MIAVHSAPVGPEVGSVAFRPCPEAPAPVPPRRGNPFRLPPVEWLLRELGQPLAQLARRVRRLGPLDGGAVVLLTGCRPGVGCSTVSLALAGAAARERPALLLDGDLDRAGLSALFGGPPVGWEQALRGLCPLGPPRRHPGPGTTLAFLPLRPPVTDPERLLAEPALPAWLARLRRDYGLIVLDGGAVQGPGARWAPLADCALLVCDSGQAPANDWAEAWDRLEEGGTSVLGIVETLVESRPPAVP